MDSSYGGEGPAVLQLHSWDSSKLQLNLAEFREAFISPSQQLLLLLSHQCKALLLPLLKGNSIDSIDAECCNDDISGDPRSLFSEDVHRFDVLDNCASTSGLERDSDSGFVSDINVSEVKTFICDVNSVAWGACGDTHNFNLDPPFKEFLFLSGSHGVIVHAFCCHDSASKEMSGTHLGEGRWMDWGPDTATCQSVLSKETPSSYHDASENIMHENRIIEDEETDSLMIEGSGKDEAATRFISKRWLRSFFTEAEMVNSDGSMGIKFPPRSSFPSSAKVVSFSIFGDCFHSSNSCLEANQQRVDLDPVDYMDISSTSRSYSPSFQSEVLSTVLGVGSDCCYSCIRVFSSNSHSWIGFVLTSKDFISTGNGNGSESCRSTNFVVVARLHSWGIKWVSSVNLSKHQTMVPIVDWTDFCFSSDLLACLTSSGLIYFYSVMTGEYVRELDIMQICQVNPLLRKPEQEQENVVNGIQTQQNGEASRESKTNCSQPYDGRKFRRLVGSSHTSLIAAVDEMGITYLLRAADYLPDKYYSNLKLLPHFRHLELGILVGWEVGGLSIGHSLANSNASEFVCEDNERASLDDNGSTVLGNTQKRYLKRKLNSIYSSFNEFSASKMACNRFKSLDFESNLRRTVFLPKDGFNKDDCICVSPLGITRLIRKNNGDEYGYQIVHHGMYSGPRVHDDWCLKSGMEKFNFTGAKECFAGGVLGCSFQSCMYLVTQNGLSVVLPRISVSPKVFSSKSVGSRQKRTSKGTSHEVGNHLKLQKSTCLWSPWKVELLDRVILYEGPEVADRLCLINGWDLKLSRIRRLQIALDFLKFDDIEKSLEMLVAVDLAEEGVLRILFSATYLLFRKGGSDNEVAATSRLLALASSFATKIIRMYGLLWQKKDGSGALCCQDQACSSLPKEVHDEKRTKKILHEMAYYLEAIRNLQFRFVIKYQKPGQGLVAVEERPGVANTSILHDDFDSTSIVLINAPSQKASDNYDYSLPVSAPGSSDMENRALTSLKSLDSGAHLDSEDLIESSVLVPKAAQDEVLTSLKRNVLPVENPQEMVSRWKMDNLDLRTVVKDALLSGRLPLAVLLLHLHRSRHWMKENEQPDTFSEVRDIGRAIAYDLFLKGETKLAVATLERLGEDIKISLKQILFGTVKRSLRLQILEEMNRCGYLGAHEWKLLERITLIERLYPSSSFWKTYLGRLENSKGITLSDNEENCLQLSLSSPSIDKKIRCGEIDGVILGSWLTVTGNSSVMDVNEDGADVGYWAAAAVWSSLWDKKIIDRIVLDQPLLLGVHVLWESQLEYYISHNDWEEVAKLLDLIPASTLSDGRIQISLDGLPLHAMVGHHREVSFSDHFSSPLDELDAVCMDVPDVKLFNFSADAMCSMWLRMHMEPLLAKQLIFTREYWESTSEIVPILARSGYIKMEGKISFGDKMPESSSYGEASKSNRSSPANSLHGLHKVIVHHCVEYNLPNLLDLYLDHHELVSDKDSLALLQEAVGDCLWAKWLLFSRVKGCEYDASFCNSRAITTPHLVPGNSLGVAETDGIIHTVDDIAEGGEELAALATLMFAHVPIQNCLSSGSVKRQSTSAQCTLENLKPILQRYPSLWRTFVAACLGQDVNSSFSGNNVKNVLGTSVLSDYLNWRENIFFSAGRDTSLVQMLPCWFPKSVRRLIQLYVQGPIGWQSLTMHGDVDLFMNCDEVHNLNEISWEALIQKHIEDELYDSSLKETGSSVEHYLHRGRALAAFNYLLGMRVQKLKLEQSAASVHGQTNVQSDMQTLLAPVIQSEESLLSSVMPLAILHFGDSVLVASCTFLLELCGLSASMLHVDVAALKRISSFYKSDENNEGYSQLSPKASAFHARLQDDVTESLARALADEYLHQDHAIITKHNETSYFVASRRHSRALSLVLQHLEKASLPLMVDGKTCGSWLLNGIGDGMELRSQQKAVSQQWSLVIAFCRMHQLPLSTKYLAVLARDNDWVGFLSEAHIGGYPFDIVMQVASKEFGDPRLRLHILTVLKNMQSRKKSGSSSHADHVEKSNITSFSDDNIYVPVELFGILAVCEKQKNPGEALLVKAKHLSWSILAMIASCFSDVSPLSCLTVWLEITAARETSSIKVNDTASQIANNVAAAVEATNNLPAGDRALSFHYNRRNPKRRRLMESMATNGLVALEGEVSNSPRAKMSIIQGCEAEEERKVEFIKHEVLSESDEGPALLSKMVAVLCEQQLFLPLLRAFELFLPSCSLLPFIRALQAFSQMRLSEASAHLGSFSVRIKEEPTHLQTSAGKEEHIASSWISSTAVKAADAVISTCPSPYEKRCLLQLLAATDFGDGGYAATHYQRLYWKINLAEPSLRIDDSLHLGNKTLDDASLLAALEKNGHWEQARKWARQLEASGGAWKSTVHHVTETQAESMVAEWREFLWDVPEERIAVWGHCQTLFIRYSFPPLQAGLFFLRHAEALEKDLPARELYELLLLALQWLSGMITLSYPVYSLNLLREIETRVWLLAVESEAQMKSEGEFSFFSSNQDSRSGCSSGIVDRTASVISKMDNHINMMRNRTIEKQDLRDNNLMHMKYQGSDAILLTSAGASTKTKRRAKGPTAIRRAVLDADKSTDPEDSFSNSNARVDVLSQDDNLKIEQSFSRWEERVGPAELERAVLSLLEFGQISAAKQLQYKLSPDHIPSEFSLVNAALKLAKFSTPCSKISISMLDEELRSFIYSSNIPSDHNLIDPLQVLDNLTTIFVEGSGRGLCRRIIAVVRTANVLGILFSEAFEKQPIELLQLLSLKAQESFEEAKFLVQTHSMPAASIAQILAESFLKGLLAAHRGGYMETQKEEGPAPLLWRFSDFLKWAELCPSESEIGHALMRIVITGQEIPHACEVELLILSHHFYKSSACLDGVDVLVALAANRVDSYVSEGDFQCLARLITGVGNFHALNFILGILIENGQLDLLLQKFSAAADANTCTAEAVRGFTMAVLTSLKQFNPNDLDAFAMVYNHFDMKHETAALLESRAEQSSQLWLHRYDKDQNEDLLESMRYFIEAAEVHSSIDAGNKTRRACAQASLVSLQIRMPDFQWLNRSETNARRALVEQFRFQEALIVAEAYGLNQPSEWALVLWNLMLQPELIEEFVAEFVAVLPLQPSMLLELARFYRAEMAARGDQSQFSVWLTGGGLPAEWAKYLARSFRCLLKRTRDLRLRMQMASLATGFEDVIGVCMKALDKVAENAGPLVLRRGHGGAYLPLM